jgi:3-oxoacyl-[acyl-carrier protein] reductase
MLHALHSTYLCVSTESTREILQLPACAERKMNVANKTAIVTGGGTGIGAATAIALASEGVRVVVAGRRSDPLAGTVAEIVRRGGRASYQICDVRDAGQCESLFKNASEELGHIDILVNNAGISGHGRHLADHSPDDWDLIMNTNLKSAFLLSRLAIPPMIRRGGGYIINMSSVSGVHCYVGESIYGISKHALNAMTRYIAEEYGTRGISAVAICPGLVHTDMGMGLEPEHLDRLLTPEDVAGAVLWAVKQRAAARLGGPIVLEPAADPWGGKGFPMHISGDDC